MLEALHRRAEAGQVFLIPRGGQRRQGAAMEGTFKANHPEALGMAFLRIILPHRLDQPLIRLGA